MTIPLILYEKREKEKEREGKKKSMNRTELNSIGNLLTEITSAGNKIVPKKQFYMKSHFQ